MEQLFWIETELPQKSGTSGLLHHSIMNLKGPTMARIGVARSPRGMFNHTENRRRIEIVRSVQYVISNSKKKWKHRKVRFLKMFYYEGLWVWGTGCGEAFIVRLSVLLSFLPCVPKVLRIILNRIWWLLAVTGIMSRCWLQWYQLPWSSGEMRMMYYSVR